MVLQQLVESCPSLAHTLQPFADRTNCEKQNGLKPTGEKSAEVQNGDSDIGYFFIVLICFCLLYASLFTLLYVLACLFVCFIF